MVLFCHRKCRRNDFDEEMDVVLLLPCINASAINWPLQLMGMGQEFED